MKINLNIETQPDDTTCGPTCLHAVYNHLGLPVGLGEVIKGIKTLQQGGTLSVFLGLDALRRGYDATIYNYNLRVFDPSWSDLSSAGLIERLSLQLQYKKGKKFTLATNAYLQFLRNGGKIKFDDLDAEMLTSHINAGTPILTGLSATYLYQSKREYLNANNESVYDDFRGQPMGHFVVLCGAYDDKVIVADPYKENPISKDNYYEVSTIRLINAILLGIITYDSNLLIVTKKDK